MGGTKGQAKHHFHQIFKLAAVVDEDSKPLFLNVPPNGLFLMEVAALNLNMWLIIFSYTL
jgi:hypothetical protein